MSAAKQILVVEDERVVARDIQRSLADLGYEVPATAATAEQAIQLATERCPDLVLMDIRIKGDRDGIETAAVLRERFDVPIVYLTAYADGPTIERAKTTQPLGYLLKPVKTNELRSAVELALYRHDTEKRMREREHWLSTTLNSIGDAVISTDREGRVTYMNPVAEALTGKRLEDVIGLPSRDVLSFSDEATKAQLVDPLERALAGGKTINFDGKLDGTSHFIADSAAPIIDGADRLLGAVMVFRDVSEQKRLRSQLELADRLAAIGTMAAGVAHEINNPLAFILGNLWFVIEELRRHKGELGRGCTPEIENALSEAQYGAERVRRVVSELQEFCRAEPRQIARLDVWDVIERALSMIDGELCERVVIVKERGATPVIEADATRLAQVFVTILLNAIQAVTSTAAASIVISTWTDPSNHVVITIRDNGCGMSPEVARRAFEPFFTTRDVGRGRGLGLAVAHGIVRSLDGRIELESAPGAGTTVRVALPRARAAERPSPRQRELEVPDGPRGNLLVIDDEPMVRSTLRRLFGREHTVTCPATPAEALELIRGGMSYDVILCDLMMPGITGKEIYDELSVARTDQARRMVFMTGGVFTPELVEFRANVRNRWVDKPFEAPVLRRLVRELLTQLGSARERGPS